MTYLTLRLQLVQQPQITRPRKNFFSIRGPAFVRLTHNQRINSNNHHHRMQKQRNPPPPPTRRVHPKKLLTPLRVQAVRMIWTKTMENPQNQTVKQTVRIVWPNRLIENMKKIKTLINAVVRLHQRHPHHHRHDKWMHRHRRPPPPPTATPLMPF